ncbi:hypothetical protein D1BOALGB6SA_3498 [Olavius sp. associated proteobacterium Delta 1]|nr:hypothetical protein D1BOALGB6SA_3498 [Olavius sp. associated proteobacterium Delta 1]
MIFFNSSVSAGTQPEGHVFENIQMRKEGVTSKNRVGMAFGGRPRGDIVPS